MSMRGFSKFIRRNEIFSLISLLLFVGFWFACSLPLITEQLLHIIPPETAIRFSFLHPLTSGIGPGKRWFTEQYILICTGLNLLLLFLCFEKNKNFFKKILIVFIIFPLYGIGLLEFRTNAFENYFNDLVFVNYPSFNFSTIFNRRMIPIDKINSYDDFYLYARSIYDQNLDVLEEGWQLHDSAELKSIYYMNFVSSLWAYGNKDNPEEIGCVFDNEVHGMTHKKDLTVKDYLVSEIGCCDDYARILKLMLDKEKIKNRLVHVRGHIFNEAFFKNKWHVLDANINTMFHDSWFDITFRQPGERFLISTFPHNNSLFSEPEFFRASVGKFRLEVITAAVKRNLFPTYEYVNDLKM